MHFLSCLAMESNKEHVQKVKGRLNNNQFSYSDTKLCTLVWQLDVVVQSHTVTKAVVNITTLVVALPWHCHGNTYCSTSGITTSVVMFTSSYYSVEIQLILLEYTQIKDWPTCISAGTLQG